MAPGSDKTTWRRVFYASVFLAVFFSATAFTPVFAEESADFDPFSNSSPQFELGLTLHKENYEEFEPDGSRIMREYGTLYGFKFAAQSTVEEGGVVRVAAEYAIGEANYIGAYQGDSYGSLRLDGLSRDLFEGTVIYRQAIPAWGGFSIQSGLGFRRLVDNLQDGGPGGYKRTNERFYATIGVGYAFRSERLRITPALDYKHSLKSRQKSDLLNGGGSLTHDQEGWGGELSVALEQSAGHYPVIVRPFYRVWRMDDSNVVMGFYEPRNDTTEIGLDVTVRF